MSKKNYKKLKGEDDIAVEQIKEIVSPSIPQPFEPKRFRAIKINPYDVQPDLLELVYSNARKFALLQGHHIESMNHITDELFTCSIGYLCYPLPGVDSNKENTPGLAAARYGRKNNNGFDHLVCYVTVWLPSTVNMGYSLLSVLKSNCLDQVNSDRLLGGYTIYLFINELTIIKAEKYKKI